MANEMAIPEPTRAAGEARLEAFLPSTGRTYAAQRNYDRGPGNHTGVSVLSPYLRHRLITEQEVLAAVTQRFAPSTAEKFVSEVFWRTYFKGFLERHPTVWSSYRDEVSRLMLELDKDGRMRADVQAAEAGETGIDCFDHWARELTDTGYLHNHARMWFASIWIFTLRLPWELGADFFLRHLLDGDPASNTLSWRWVGGLHTKGKTYLARPDNIAKFTEGRFNPKGLAPHAEPLEEFEDHPTRPAPEGDKAPDGPALLLVTEEDCVPETLGIQVAGACAATAVAGRSPREVASGVIRFTDGAVADAAARNGDATAIAFTADAIAERAEAAGTDTIATAYPPVGPAADALDTAESDLRERGLTVHRVLRAEDARAWPFADRGFFKVKKKIPKLLPA